MSAPSVSSVSASPAATFLSLTSNGGAGAGTALGAQLSGFLNFLHNSNAASKTLAGMMPSDHGQASARGLPAQFFALSANDASLQDLLGQIEQAGLPQNVLMALTMGVPSDALPDGAQNADGVATLTLDQLSDLISTNGDALSNSNILLVAANISPSDMEQLTQSLSKSLDQVSGGKGTSTAGDADGSSEQDNSIHLFLVTLVAPDADQAAATDDLQNGNPESSEAIAQTSLDSEATPDATDVTNDINWAAFASLLSGLYAPKDTQTPTPSADGDAAITAAGSAEQKSVSSPFSTDGLSTADIAALKKDVGNGVADPGFDAKSAADKAGGHGANGASFHDAVKGSLKPDATSANPLTLPASALQANSAFSIDGSSLLGSGQMAASGLASSTVAQANPVVANTSAAYAHPASQALAAALSKTFENGEVKTQTLSVEIDPPELGRVQIHLSAEDGGPLQLKLITEKEETLNLLRRDSHALRHALDNAGIQTDGSGLSFDMSHDSSAFQQAMDQSGKQNNGASFRLTGGDGGSDAMLAPALPVTDTSLGIHLDPETGQLHYNLLA